MKYVVNNPRTPEKPVDKNVQALIEIAEKFVKKNTRRPMSERIDVIMEGLKPSIRP